MKQIQFSKYKYFSCIWDDCFVNYAVAKYNVGQFSQVIPLCVLGVLVTVQTVYTSTYINVITIQDIGKGQNKF